MHKPPMDHEYFEELCAIAALGQLSEEEFTVLEQHLAECQQCCDFRATVTGLAQAGIPSARETKRWLPGWLVSQSESEKRARERFAKQASTHGLYFSPEAASYLSGAQQDARWPAYARYGSVTVAAMAIVASILFWGRLRYEPVPTPPERTNAAVVKQQQPAAEAPSVRHSPETRPAPPAVDVEQLRADFSRKLTIAQQEVAALRDQSQARQERLERSSQEAEELRAQLDTEKQSAAALARKLATTEDALSRASDDLHTVKASNVTSAATVTAQDVKIKEMNDVVRQQGSLLQRQETLLTATRDVRDLMGARNLHIIDVLDVDGKGRNRGSFGRVFYTEGKSLIFYAFDLSQKGAAATNASFQGWAARTASSASARSIGIFYVDDKEQNRWVLKFDDPAVLSYIDSVFVTVEPRGGNKEPTGHRLLYAFLRTQANHP